MKSFKKRLAAFAVVVLMVAMLIPTAAFAAIPAIQDQPEDASVKVGEDASFTIVPTSEAGTTPTYLWKVSTDGGKTYTAVDSGVTGYNAAMLELDAVTAGMNGNIYACEVTPDSGDGTADFEISADAELTVTSATAPEIQTQPTALSKEVGQDAQFSVMIATNANITTYAYQWEMKKNGAGAWIAADGIGLTKSTLDVKGVTKDQDGNIYRCKITVTDPDTKEFVYSDEAKLTVNEPSTPTDPVKPAKPTVTVTADPASGWLTGKSVTLTANINVRDEDKDALDIQWYFEKKNGMSFDTKAPIKDATTATLTINELKAADHDGKYTCEVINKNAESVKGVSNAITLEVLDPTGEITINTQPAAPAKVYAGDRVELKVEATTDNDGTLTYQWMSSPKGLDRFTKIEGATSATYVVEKVTADLGKFKCVVSNAKGGATKETDEVSFTLSTKNDVPVFDKNLEANTLTLAGDTLTLSVHAAAETGDEITYQWSVKDTDGEREIIGATGESYTLPTADNNKVYYCTAINKAANKTTKSVETTIKVADPKLIPEFTKQPESIVAEATNGEDMTMSVEVKPIDTKTFSYQWQKQNGATWDAVADAGQISGATTATLKFSQGYIATEDGVYRCEVSISGGNEFARSSSATFLAYTAATPYLTTDLPAAMDAEAGKTATFTVAAAVQPEAPLAYQWYTVNGGDTIIPGAKSASYTTGVLTEADNGAQFKCVVTNQNTGDYVDSTVVTLNVKTSSTPPALDDNMDPSLEADRESGMLKGIAAGANAASAKKASELAAMFTPQAGYTVAIVDKNGNKLADDAVVGTGCMVKMLAADSSEADSLIIVVKGDVTGKGYASVTDMVQIANHITGTALTGAYFEAANMNNDNTLSVTDMVQISGIIAG